MMPSEPIRHSLRHILPKIKISNTQTTLQLIKDQQMMENLRQENTRRSSPAGNRTPVSRVTGGDAHRQDLKMLQK